MYINIPHRFCFFSCFLGWFVHYTIGLFCLLTIESTFGTECRICILCMLAAMGCTVYQRVGMTFGASVLSSNIHESLLQVSVPYHPVSPQTYSQSPSMEPSHLLYHIPISPRLLVKSKPHPGSIYPHTYTHIAYTRISIPTLPYSGRKRRIAVQSVHSNTPYMASYMQ